MRSFTRPAVLLCGVLAAIVLSSASYAAAGEPKDAFFTTKDGVKIHYITQGDSGSWVVLIHGFTDTAKRMFYTTGIAPALAKNHRVMTFDHRNHGDSDKPQPGQMGRPEDAIELMDHLKIDKAHIYGYSMGGGFVGTLLAKYPERFITAIFGGSGIWEYQQAQHDHAVAWDKEIAAKSAQPAARGGAAPSGAQGSAPRGERAGAGAPPQGLPGGQPAVETSANKEPPSPFTPVAAARPHSRTPIDLSKVSIPVMSINGSRDTPFVKTQRMFRELRDFTNVILQDHDHMSAIAVSGPMPQQHVDALVRFVDGHDLSK